MKDNCLIPINICRRLRTIPASRAGRLRLYPCRVSFTDDSVRPHVYVVDADAFAAHGGPDGGRRGLAAADVVSVHEASDRLPAPFADAIYEAGETGMGYSMFTLVFGDGNESSYCTGEFVDFLPYPGGYTSHDVVRVDPHRGLGEHASWTPLPYEWCPVRGLDDALGAPQ